MDELLPDFLAETTEALAECDTLLVRLEQAPGDAATLGQIFRLVHTIKGTCGFLGLSRLEKVAHAAENLLGKFRDGALAATPGRVSVVLGALDVVRRIGKEQTTSRSGHRDVPAAPVTIQSARQLPEKSAK